MNEDRFELSYFGPRYSTYSGSGSLTIINGQKIDCDFDLGQLLSGQVVLLCKCELSVEVASSVSAIFQHRPIKQFEGKTSEGYCVSSIGNIREADQQTEWRQSDPSVTTLMFALFPDRVEIKMAEETNPATIHFGITNFEFYGSKSKEASGRLAFVALPIRLNTKDGEFTCEIEQTNNYKVIVKRLSSLKGIEVTCEVKFDGFECHNKLEQVVDNICYLLSVASGGKIQWIYCKQLDKDGEIIHYMLASRVTKPYSPLNVINNGPSIDEKRSRVAEVSEIQAFIESAYPIYVGKKNEYKLNKGLIDSYLDGKAEADYLESRGIKIIMALELLKDIFLQAEPIDKLIINKEEFESMQSLIQEALSEILKKDKSIESNQRGEVYSKIKELNKKTFRAILEQICEIVDLDITKDEMDLIIKSRNSLVHTGSFYFENLEKEERARIQINMVADEYFFMVNFLDKLILKLLGYTGTYINRFNGQIEVLS